MSNTDKYSEDTGRLIAMHLGLTLAEELMERGVQPETIDSAKLSALLRDNVRSELHYFLDESFRRYRADPEGDGYGNVVLDGIRFIVAKTIWQLGYSPTEPIRPIFA